MSVNIISATDVETRLAAAQARRRRAAAEESRLRRELVEAARRRAATTKIVLGAALLRAAEAHPSAVPGLVRLLDPHVTRPGDREALRDTPLALPEVADAAASAAVEGGKP
ncbi:hypothetical protein [Azospirillum brasilense]|uniref:Mobilization protein n=1 Tax=Azospirillum brasilense TaxID=192 RepID=A0A6L3B606_AZOBR|nr:hypothetical protein [Azospirillum brasilense]KAA0686615.1 hypothetical protein DS837_09145 [Azospirillum brasilense]